MESYVEDSSGLLFVSNHCIFRQTIKKPAEAGRNHISDFRPTPRVLGTTTGAACRRAEA